MKYNAHNAKQIPDVRAVQYNAGYFMAYQRITRLKLVDNIK